jgi:serine/threonine protein kinase
LFACRNLIPRLPWTINGYTFTELVGRGSFSDVYKVTSARFEEGFCAKVQLMDGDDHEKKEKSMIFSAELSSLTQLDHPHIVRLYDVFTTDRFFILILEYCSHGDLGKEIDESGRLSVERFLIVARQIGLALAYCHSMKIAHRDVKPANVLFDEYGRAKLADFGLAIRPQGLTGKRCGSLFFQAPEIVQRREYDPFPCDIWSLGCTFCAMLDGEHPWRSNAPEIVKTKIAIGQYTIGDDVPANIKDLISRMLVLDPSKRITINDVLADPVFQEAEAIKVKPVLPVRRMTIRPVGGSLLRMRAPLTRRLSEKCESTKSMVFTRRIFGKPRLLALNNQLE